MGRSSGSFGGYRGRRTITDILRLIAITLAVVVVLVLVGLWVGQEYLVYTDDGLRLELPPFLQSLRQGRPQEDPGPGNIHYTETPDSSGDTSQEENPPASVAPVSYELPVQEVTGGTAAARLEELGGAELILQMKGQDGKLAWYSEDKTAQWSEVSGPREVNTALEQWNTGEVWTIARVCCFRDDAAPYHNNAIALRRGQYNWRDELGLRWMSPAVPAAREYLAALCGELAALGFDEIVLEDFGFPTQGNLDTINRGDRYDPTRLTQDVEAFLTQVEQALAPYGTRLSLRVSREVLAGQGETGGVTAQLLERFAGRLWIEQDGLLPAPADLLAQAGLSGGTDRLVEITAQAVPEYAAAQAVLQP